jgi:hypothetical protein
MTIIFCATAPLQDRKPAERRVVRTPEARSSLHSKNEVLDTHTHTRTHTHTHTRTHTHTHPHTHPHTHTQHTCFDKSLQHQRADVGHAKCRSWIFDLGHEHVAHGLGCLGALRVSGVGVGVGMGVCVGVSMGAGVGEGKGVRLRLRVRRWISRKMACKSMLVDRCTSTWSCQLCLCVWHELWGG